MHAQHQHRDGRVLRAEPLEHLQESGAGHRDVEQDHVRREPGKGREQLVAVHRLSHDAEAGLLVHDPAQAVAHDRVIVGDEQADHGIHPGSE